MWRDSTINQEIKAKRETEERGGGTKIEEGKVASIEGIHKIGASKLFKNIFVIFYFVSDSSGNHSFVICTEIL